LAYTLGWRVRSKTEKVEIRLVVRTMRCEVDINPDTTPP